MIAVNLVQNKIVSRRIPKANDKRCIITQRLHHMTFWTAHKIIQAMQSTLIFINMRPYDRAQEMHVTEAYGLIKKFTDALEKDLLANRQKYAEVAQEIGGDCTVILKESLHPHIFAAYLGFHLRDMINTHPPLRTETNLSTLFDLVEMQLDCNGTD